MTTTANRPPPAAPAEEESKEDQRRRLDTELAQSNLLRQGQCIGEAGEMLLTEARRVDAQGRRVTPAALMITNTLALGMALLTQRRAAALVHARKGPAAGRITRVLMERVPLPGQIAQAPAPAAAPVESEGSKPANAGANAALGVSDGLVARPVEARPEESAPRAGPDAPDRGEGWELLTDEPPPVISCGSQGADEERADQVLSMALEVEAEKGKDPMTSALMRALARSRGPR